MDLQEKLQELFDSAKCGVTIDVSLEFEDLSLLLALVKADNVYTKALETHMLQAFDKLD